MPDKKPKFTRRKLLGGLAIIGTAGATGAGTIALSRDNETERTTVTAGGPENSTSTGSESDQNRTLDLKVGGSEGVIKVNAGTLQPGDTFKNCETLSNSGDISGRVLSMSIPKDSIETKEGTNYDEETDTSGEGELEDHLDLKAYLVTPNAKKSRLFFHGGKETYIPFNTVVDRGPAPVDFSENDLKPIVGEQKYEFCFVLRYASEDSREVFGDVLGFDIELTLEQQSQSKQDKQADQDEEENRQNKKAANGVPSVTVSNQYFNGTTIYIDSVTVPKGGFVTVHDSSLRDGGVAESVIGTSEYLSPGRHTNVKVDLYQNVRGADYRQQKIKNNAMIYTIPCFDTNSNKQFDFVTTEGGKDGPYVKNGSVIVDDAYVVRGWA